MSIRTNIEEVQATVDQQRANSGGRSSLANELQEKAVATILGGAAAWENYMNAFAKDEKELGRLRAEPNTDENFERNLARSYLVGNGNCGAASPDGTEYLFGVTDTLDY
jgi:hypothetical protein